MCVVETWDASKDADLVIAQAQAHLALAKVHVEFLLEEDVEIGHKELVTLEEDQDDYEFTDAQKTQFVEWKERFTTHVTRAVTLGTAAK